MTSNSSQSKKTGEKEPEIKTKSTEVIIFMVDDN